MMAKHLRGLIELELKEEDVGISHLPQILKIYY